MKKCTQCGETKPFQAFGVRAASHDGLNAACRACIKTARRVRKVVLGLPVRPLPPEGMKQCPDCGELKPLSAFGLRKRKGRNATLERLPNCHCRHCVVRRAKSWASAKPEARKTQVIRYRLSKAVGIPPAAIPPDLIELQRVQLEIKCVRRELKKTLENANDDHA